MSQKKSAPFDPAAVLDDDSSHAYSASMWSSIYTIDFKGTIVPLFPALTPTLFCPAQAMLCSAGLMALSCAAGAIAIIA